VLRFIGCVGLLGSTISLAACGGPPAKMVATKDDGVPANSASEERLNGGAAKPKPVETTDPSQPLTTPMTGAVREGRPLQHPGRLALAVHLRHGQLVDDGLAKVHEVIAG